MRNVAILAVAVLVGVIALQPFMAASMSFLEGRSFEAGLEEFIFHLIDLLPTAIASSIVGLVAGFGIKSSRPARWSLIVASVVAVLLILSVRYIAPQFAAWFIAILKIIIPSALAWLSFTLVQRKRTAAV